MRSFVITTVITVTLCIVSSCAFAQFVTEQATFNDADCSSPALASSPDGVTVLAYGASGEPLTMDFVEVLTLRTEFTVSQPMPSPVLLNAGYSPVVCYSRTGFYLAFSSGGMVMIYHADSDGNWDTENFSMLEPDGPVVGLDLWGITSGNFDPDVFLTVEVLTDQGTMDHHVLFASCTDLTWSDFQTVGNESNMLNAHITGVLGDSTPFPVVFYMVEEEGLRVLKSVTYMGLSGWSIPSLVANSPVQNEYDVVGYGYCNVNILGLGAQPACPCGSIHHQSCTIEGGWSDPEELTERYAAYDWPMSPCLAVGSAENENSKVHAFWLQEAASSDMNPWRKTLEYKVLENGTWTDAGAFLNERSHGPPLGPRVALAVDPAQNPVLAWTRTDTIDGQPQPEQVWIARRAMDSSTTGETPTRLQSTLSAYPNPFNPQVRISFNSQNTQRVRLNIYDARGHHIAELLDSVVGSGVTDVQWQGKDTAGRSLPSGIYFARLVTDVSSSVIKLVLAE